MALEEHLEILDKGIETWNEWRKLHPGVKIDLAGADLRNLDLQEINLSNANLERANFANSDMRNANLASANLERACLAFADLEHAMLAYANLTDADLRAVNLNRASLEDANLCYANMAHASLEGAILAYVNLAHANLMDADLIGINLQAANLEGVNVSTVKFDTNIAANLFKNSRGSIKYLWQRRFDLLLDTTVRCRGVNASSCYGSQRFKLFLQDQDYLEEFLETSWGRRICYLWWLSADCGRSLFRWAGWSVMIAFIYALVYYLLGAESFSASFLEINLRNMIYYSVVTFTTLGFGDITPKTTSAAMIVMTEVIIGYIMLGGLITIFASKLARRGG